MAASTKKKVKQLSEEELDKVAGGLSGKRISDNPVYPHHDSGVGSGMPPLDREPHVLES